MSRFNFSEIAPCLQKEREITNSKETDSPVFSQAILQKTGQLFLSLSVYEPAFLTDAFLRRCSENQGSCFSSQQEHLLL